MNNITENKTSKPYDKCIRCSYLGVRCDGPNPLAMVKPDSDKPLERLSEWCRLRKEYLHSQDTKWTNAYIAEEAQVAKATVDNFLAGKVQDIKLSSLVRIFKTLVNGSWGEYPCAMEENERDLLECQKELDIAQGRIKELEKDNADLFERKNHFKELYYDANDQLQKKDQQIADGREIIKDRGNFMRRKDSWIVTFFIVALIGWSIIIAALVIDKANPNVGFFWLDGITAFINSNLHNAIEQIPFGVSL